MLFSNRANSLSPSATLSMNVLAKDRQKLGLQVYNLSTGEPDLGTPMHVKKAAKKAIDEDFTYYTATGGTTELKQAIINRMRDDLKIEYNLNEVTTANGGKQILFNLFQVLLNDGDEVIVADPYWLSYKTQVELAGGKLVAVATSEKNNFRPEATQILKAITKKTKAIILNSPSNPSGAVMTESDLREIAAGVLNNNILIISDDVYESFVYLDERPSHILLLEPAIRDQLVIVNSVSKSYAMTGWRLGWALGPKELISKMEELQSHASSNACSISQKAAIAALSGPQEGVEKMLKKFVLRRKWLAKAFKKQKKLKLFLPDGAFYALIDCREVMKSGESDLEFCMRLLQETGVAVVPGNAFGEVTKGMVRISFAVKDEVLHEGIGKFLDFLN